MPAAVSNSLSHHHHHASDSGPSQVGGSSSSLCGSSARNTHTHLTYSRLHLIGTAVETIKIAENGEYTNSKGNKVLVKDDLNYAVDNSVHYEHEFDFHAALELHDMEAGKLGASLESLDEGGGANATGGGKGLYPSPGGPGRRPPPRRSSSGLSDGSNDSGGRSGAGLGSLYSSNTMKLSFRGTNGSGGSTESRFPRTSFLVVSASWLEAASELLKASSTNGNNIRVGVLNSASGSTPGGRFLKGTVSQEDCLCRASLLYSCISQPKFQASCRFYGKNRSFTYGTSNCVIFSPDVPVIRKDNVEGKLLDSYEKVSFVSLPAPNAFTTDNNTGKEHNGLNNNGEKQPAPLSPGESNDADTDEKFEKKRRALLSSLSDRIHRALGAFVLGNCTDLILPAFGCGVHGNDPAMVATVFREMLTDQNQFGGRFRTVVFAIPPSRKQNYQAFAAYFQKKDRVAMAPTLRSFSSRN